MINIKLLGTDVIAKVETDLVSTRKVFPVPMNSFWVCLLTSEPTNWDKLPETKAKAKAWADMVVATMERKK